MTNKKELEIKIDWGYNLQNRKTYSIEFMIYHPHIENIKEDCVVDLENQLIATQTKFSTSLEIIQLSEKELQQIINELENYTKDAIMEYIMELVAFIINNEPIESAILKLTKENEIIISNYHITHPFKFFGMDKNFDDPHYQKLDAIEKQKLFPIRLKQLIENCQICDVLGCPHCSIMKEIKQIIKNWECL